MTEQELVGTWAQVAYGDMAAIGQHLLHLMADGTAVSEGVVNGVPYRTVYTWQLTGPESWELRRTIPLGEIPELDEESVEVLKHTVMAHEGTAMSVTKFDYESPFHYKRVK
jgi:hypothetical protein